MGLGLGRMWRKREVHGRVWERGDIVFKFLFSYLCFFYFFWFSFLNEKYFSDFRFLTGSNLLFIF